MPRLALDREVAVNQLAETAKPELKGDDLAFAIVRWTVDRGIPIAFAIAREPSAA